MIDNQLQLWIDEERLNATLAAAFSHFIKSTNFVCEDMLLELPRSNYLWLHNDSKSFKWRYADNGEIRLTSVTHYTSNSYQLIELQGINLIKKVYDY